MNIHKQVCDIFDTLDINKAEGMPIDLDYLSTFFDEATSDVDKSDRFSLRLIKFNFYANLLQALHVLSAEDTVKLASASINLMTPANVDGFVACILSRLKDANKQYLNMRSLGEAISGMNMAMASTPRENIRFIDTQCLMSLTQKFADDMNRHLA